MSLVWDKPLPIARKMVLLSLADQSNDAGQCWPELDDLAARCSMSRRTLFDCLRELEEAGFLTRIHRGQPGKLKVVFQVNEDALRQQELLVGEDAEAAFERGRQAGAKSAPVRDLHRCEIRTGAGNGKTPVRNLHPIKQPKNSNPKGISTGARASLNEPSGNSEQFVQPPDHVPGAGEMVGSFEGHGNGPFAAGQAAPTPAGRIAVELRRRGFAATSMDPDLLGAVAQGVTFEQVVELADLHPPDPNYRNSAAYVLSIACSQRQRAAAGATSTSNVPRGTHATDHPGPRRSASERVADRIREAEQRDAAAAAAPHALVADG